MKTDYDFRLPEKLYSTEVVLAGLMTFQEKHCPIKNSDRARELFQGAIAIYGIERLTGKQWFLAIPDQDPPDYYASEAPGPKHPGYVAFENKSITNYQREAARGFTAKGVASVIKVLGSKYAFTDPLVTLAVHLNYDADTPLSHKQVHEELLAILGGVENAVWLFGEQQKGSWFIQYVYPGLGNQLEFELPSQISAKAEDVDAVVAMIRGKLSASKPKKRRRRLRKQP